MNKLILSIIAITITAILFSGCAAYPDYGYGRGYYNQPYYQGYRNYNYNPGYRGYGYRGREEHEEHEEHEHNRGWHRDND